MKPLYYTNALQFTVVIKRGLTNFLKLKIDGKYLSNILSLKFQLILDVGLLIHSPNLLKGLIT